MRNAPRDAAGLWQAVARCSIVAILLGSPGIASGQTISTVAGSGIRGDSGDGGPALSANLADPAGMAIDSAGNLYVADSDNDVVRKVTLATGVITTVAGTRVRGFSGDGGLATSADLNSPTAVAIGPDGNLYIADRDNFRVRKVDLTNGIITTYAGNGLSTFSGDGGLATSAGLDAVPDLTFDGAGNLYVACKGQNRVRKVAASTGIITTVAGSGANGFAGDGAQAISASLDRPEGVAVDASGNLYIADTDNNRVRKVTAATGVITTVAGNGIYGYSGDGSLATSASMRKPGRVAVDSSGHIYISDTENHRVRKVDAGSGFMSTLAGTGSTAFAGDGGPASSATLDHPEGLRFDSAGNLYVADEWHARVRRITFPASPANPPRVANISTRMQVLTGNDVMIGGFVIGGSSSKTVAIVATGPSLAQFGITNPLVNPTLTIVRSSDQAVMATNDDWQAHANSAQLTAAGFAPSNAQEAAVLISLAPGAYTAIVQGANNGTGVAVIGVYEVDGPEVPLVNISTRGRVLTGNDVMIGGFVIQGTGPQTVAIVATGPSLAQFGIASPLANPSITLVRSSDQATLATNDDWQADGSSAQLQAAGFAPGNSLESGLYRTLQPGAYTVVVQGVGGGTGVAVIGVYKVN